MIINFILSHFFLKGLIIVENQIKMNISQKIFAIACPMKININKTLCTSVAAQGSWKILVWFFCHMSRIVFSAIKIVEYWKRSLWYKRRGKEEANNTFLLPIHFVIN